MPKQMYYKELVKGTRSWNGWIAQKRSEDPQFTVDLTNLDLRKEAIVGTELEQPLYQAGAFLQSIDFNNSILSFAHFEDAHMTLGHLDDTECTGAIFNGANLTHASLKAGTFYHASFVGTKLEGTFLRDNSDFSYANFQRANLGGSKMINAMFESTNFQDSKLMYVEMDGSSFDHSEFKGAQLEISSLDIKTSFIGTKFYDCLIGIGKRVDENIAIKVLSRGVINNAQFMDPVLGRKVRDQAWLNRWRENIDRAQPQWFSPLENFLRRVKSSLTLKLQPVISWLKRFFKIPLFTTIEYFSRRILQFLWWISSNYGRNTWPWIMWSFGFIIIFAFIYNSLGFNHFDIEKIPKENWGFGAYLYYSVVTFTTLGFGDITARSHWGMFWASLEVICGYVMLGGLIAIFATKVARRND